MSDNGASREVSLILDLMLADVFLFLLRISPSCVRPSCVVKEGHKDQSESETGSTSLLHCSTSHSLPCYPSPPSACAGLVVFPPLRWTRCGLVTWIRCDSVFGHTYVHIYTSIPGIYTKLTYYTRYYS